MADQRHWFGDGCRDKLHGDLKNLRRWEDWPGQPAWQILARVGQHDYPGIQLPVNGAGGGSGNRTAA